MCKGRTWQSWVSGECMDSNRQVCSVFMPAASRKRRVPGWTCTSIQMFHFRCWMGTVVWALRRSAITPGACAVISSSWAACGQSPRTENSTVSFGNQRSPQAYMFVPKAATPVFPLAFLSFAQAKLRLHVSFHDSFLLPIQCR